jgi:hypothetical protein
MAKVIQKITSGQIQLSQNFYLTEFTDSDRATRDGISNIPDPGSVKNLFALAELMQKVRKLLGDKIISISSGYRSLELNTATGGSSTSEHMTGEACDFSCRGFGTPLQVASAIAKSSIKFGQLIQEGNWIHISLPGRFNQSVMTAHFVKGQKTRYVEGLV